MFHVKFDWSNEYACTQYAQSKSNMLWCLLEMLLLILKSMEHLAQNISRALSQLTNITLLSDRNLPFATTGGGVVGTGAEKQGEMSNVVDN